MTPAAPDGRRRGVVIGDAAHPEFADAIRWLSTRFETSRFGRIAEALEFMSSSLASPDLFLLTESHPGEHAVADIRRLHAAAPLARMVALVGPWCDGESRSGQPPPGVIRVPWHAWKSRLPREVSEHPSGLAWRVPRTATPAERLLEIMDREPSLPPRSATVAIFTERQVDWEGLADICRQSRLDVVELRQPFEATGEPPGGPPGVVLADLPISPEDRTGIVRALAIAFPGVPILALVDFPRPDECERLLSAGARALLAKPLLIADLWRALAAP